MVEDDRPIARLVELELSHRGLVVRCAGDGISGLAAARSFGPEAIVLDIMLPGLDGVGVLKRLRAEGNRTPVIMLTARDTLQDKIHSLDLGADDYLTKPFEIEELLARLRALVRRSEGEEILQVADLSINTATREVRRAGSSHAGSSHAGGEHVDGRGIALTNREYELLEFMARNHRRVLSRELLLSRVWEEELGVGTNVVDVYVGYLRKKVDLPGEPRLIQTVRGAGYALREG